MIAYIDALLMGALLVGLLLLGGTVVVWVLA